ncbi:MAG: ATP-dependent acyl-CoA ligase [Rhodoferax sp.]|nr:ATP-dependent acyl-CoA ligase [Rhodoferax sp.]
MSQAAPAHPSWFDAALPTREQCVLGPLLDHWAATTPNAVFAIFEDGTQWTWQETHRQVRATAQALQGLGVGRGDAVVGWLPNGRPLFLAWFACNYLGAVFVPVNTSYRGALLQHVIGNSGAKLMVCHAALVERLRDIARGSLRQVVVHGALPAAPLQGCELLPAEVLEGDEARLAPIAPVERWDTHGIIYTSGTTGPSKGVLTSYLQVRTTGLACYGYIGPQDRMLVNLPMFHVGGTTSIYAVLARGASFVLVDAFDSKTFWSQIRTLGCTTTAGLIGVMAEFLAKAEPSAQDADNPLRIVTLAPVSAQTVQLAERYGFDYVTGFNMTEVSVPLVADVNTRAFGSCGRPRQGVQCRLVDANDMEVPDGEPGELVLRTDLPWAITTGYHAMPEATARAWRNGWFHTGDVFRKDAAGNFYFIDRAKDAIRRRGENISSLEVEREVMAHPAVQEAAAIPVPNPDGEDDVMVVLAAKPGQAVDPAGLLHFLIPRMAHFMVPRYLRVLPALPKTPTNKIQKVELRQQGITPDTWDREQAGISVRREKLA